jgi:transcriptional regulator with XRE-family HTH domain
MINRGMCMELFKDCNKILEKINSIRTEKKIGIDKIATDLKKDKSVVSRLLNGKYSLDLVDFINICKSLGVEPSTLLDSILNPGTTRVLLSKENLDSFENILELINSYRK